MCATTLFGASALLAAAAFWSSGVRGGRHIVLRLVQSAGQLLNPFLQLFDFPLVGQAQTGQRLVQAIIEGFLHLFHGFAGMVTNPFLDLFHPGLGLVLGVALHFAAGFNQGIKKTTALFLGPCEGTQTRQPNLVGILANISSDATQGLQRASIPPFFLILVIGHNPNSRRQFHERMQREKHATP